MDTEIARIRPVPTGRFPFSGPWFWGYIVWHLAYETYLKPATLLDEYITQNLIVFTEAVVEVLGYEPLALYQENDGEFAIAWASAAPKGCW